MREQGREIPRVNVSGKFLGYPISPGLLRYLASSLPTAVYVICIVVKKRYNCLNV